MLLSHFVWDLLLCGVLCRVSSVASGVSSRKLFLFESFLAASAFMITGDPHSTRLRRQPPTKYFLYHCTTRVQAAKHIVDTCILFAMRTRQQSPSSEHSASLPSACVPNMSAVQISEGILSTMLMQTPAIHKLVRSLVGPHRPQRTIRRVDLGLHTLIRKKIFNILPACTKVASAFGFSSPVYFSALCTFAAHSAKQAAC